MKIITKILANRLQKVILRIIHTNPYGFIKDKSIQDCLGYAFEFLGTATSLVLLNGVPGKNIHCRRGMRQGDPLSLLLLAADLLQSVINNACQ